MRIDFKEFQPAGNFKAVTDWAAKHGLPQPWQMQVHPDGYQGWVKEVEWRIAFDMPDGRCEMIRPEDYIGLTDEGSIHAVDWLDVLKNFHLAAPSQGEKP